MKGEIAQELAHHYSMERGIDLDDALALIKRYEAAVLREIAAELRRDSDRHIDEDCDDCYADAARGGNSAREELAEEYTRRADALENPR